MQFLETELLATWGPAEARDRFAAALAEAGIEPDQWERFRQARELTCFSDTETADWRHVPAPNDDDSAAGLAHDHDLQAFVANALAPLSARERLILSLRYGLGQREHTLEEVGELLGVTRERVRQIQAKAEMRLRRKLQHTGHDEAQLLND